MTVHNPTYEQGNSFVFLRTIAAPRPFRSRNHMNSTPVFDAGCTPDGRLRINAGAQDGLIFHRNARDARTPRRIVTAALMGDPQPGRSAQDKLDAARARPSV